MAWDDMGGMGDTALAGLDDALADLNDSFGDLSGFDALTGSVKFAIPVVVGGGLSFGTAAALDYFITEAETRDSVLPYKWLIGAGVSLLAGLAMYKFQGPVEGVVTMATGVVTSLAGWGMEAIKTAQAEAAVAAATTSPAATTATPGLREYVVVKNPMPIFERYRKPMPTFGEYEVVKNPMPVFEKFLDVRQPVEMMGMHGPNPGIYG
jgi:hypothetical protein